MTRLPELREAALAVTFGMDGWRFLTDSDRVELAVRRAVLTRVIADQEQLRQDLAVRIAQQVGRLFGGR